MLHIIIIVLCYSIIILITLPYRCRGTTEASTADYWKPANPNLYKITNCTLEGSGKSQCPFEECRIGNSFTCPSGYIYDNEEIQLSAIQRVKYNT